jgi:hypothetical protein
MAQRVLRRARETPAHVRRSGVELSVKCARKSPKISKRSTPAPGAPRVVELGAAPTVFASRGAGGWRRRRERAGRRDENEFAREGSSRTRGLAAGASYGTFRDHRASEWGSLPSGGGVSWRRHRGERRQGGRTTPAMPRRPGRSPSNEGPSSTLVDATLSDLGGSRGRRASDFLFRRRAGIVRSEFMIALRPCTAMTNRPGCRAAPSGARDEPGGLSAFFCFVF